MVEAYCEAMADAEPSATGEPVPRADLPSWVDRRTQWEEVVIVLALSLLPSAIYALITLFEAPIAGVTVRAAFDNVDVVRQVVNVVFGLAPVALVLHIGRRSAEGLSPFGLGVATVRSDVMWGLAGGLAIAAVGLFVYLGSLALEINRFVVPVPPIGYWWTVPILVLGALAAALLEEVIGVGYLVSRLERLGWPGVGAVASSALLRGGYHLYQGWGGFAGNVALGAVFGFAFLRWRRTWPLVVAHLVVDVLAGLGYLAFRGQCLFGVCIPGDGRATRAGALTRPRGSCIPNRLSRRPGSRSWRPGRCRPRHRTPRSRSPIRPCRRCTPDPPDSRPCRHRRCPPSHCRRRYRRAGLWCA